jgi:hypothetical protein
MGRDGSQVMGVVSFFFFYIGRVCWRCTGLETD